MLRPDLDESEDVRVRAVYGERRDRGLQRREGLHDRRVRCGGWLQQYASGRGVPHRGNVLGVGPAEPRQLLYHLHAWVKHVGVEQCDRWHGL